jgi:hypothetical protein
MDPNPPPPYSETDIYSNTSSHSILTPGTSQADTTSVAGHVQLSTASSVDDSVIYTPLPSPTGSDHQESLQNGFDHVSTSSAISYFELRPTHRQSPTPLITHKITVTPRTQPEELEYNEAWETRDITQQDWATFVNYLLPEHTAVVNNDVADRKLQQEIMDERMHLLSLGNDRKSRADMSEVSAQLDPLRQPLSSRSTESLSALSSTISEWNEGFFKPRGLHIVISGAEPPASAEESNHIPGAWIPYDHEILAESPNNDHGGRRGLFGSFRTFPGMESNSGSFRIGPIVADNDGLRIGKNLVVRIIHIFSLFFLECGYLWMKAMVMIVFINPYLRFS